MNRVHRGRGYDYFLRYHIVWCVTNRTPIFVGEVAEATEKILRERAKENEIDIVELTVAPDHVHVLVDCKPQQPIPNMVKAFKGGGARHVFMRYPELKDKVYRGFLWRASYFVAIDNPDIQEQIQEYINRQPKK
ncbi:IS200/IS605 family transposase [Enterococcus faecalis]|uniref:IS200/IS605 family transposase n=1 Tax=Enterococcus faecalis TaxID=1351 RepID=UPI003CC614E4